MHKGGHGAYVLALIIEEENILVNIDVFIVGNAVVKGAFVRIVADQTVFAALAPRKLVCLAFVVGNRVSLGERHLVDGRAVKSVHF